MSSGRIVIELTNRCPLACEHCFSGRHGGHDDLPLPILDRILAEARGCGFDHLSFTGGEPTVHRQFLEVVRRVHEAGYDFSFVSNGWTFARLHPELLPFRDRLRVVTFSLDGATEASHDRIRGPGSFRRLMQALSVCVAVEIPFTLNMVVMAHNRHELERMATLAARLGSRGLRFGHLMPAPGTTALALDLSPAERKQVDAEIHELQRESALPIGIAPGHYTTDLFPCAPLQGQEVNVDCRGNLTKCCHLSGHGPGGGDGDVAGDLRQIGFAAGLARLRAENEHFHRQKLERLRKGELGDADFFACWHCSVHYDKVGWMKGLEDHPWARLLP